MHYRGGSSVIDSFDDRADADELASHFNLRYQSANYYVELNHRYLR